VKDRLGRRAFRDRTRLRAQLRSHQGSVVILNADDIGDKTPKEE
jgi:hypothetical protein